MSRRATVLGPVPVVGHSLRGPPIRAPASRAECLESARDIGQRRGGVAATRKKRETSRRIWCQAMSEMGVSEQSQMLFSVENFQLSAGWAALQLERQDLNFITALLNKLGSPRGAWTNQHEILDIKSAYLDRRAVDLARRTGAPEVRERVCIADDRLRSFIELGERIATAGGGWAQADHERLGVISWVLIMTLFVVRASTMGALQSADDVWFEENPAWSARDGTVSPTDSLCMTIRFLKHWRAGVQTSTGRRLPIHRVGRDSIPIPRDASHWRTRASLVIRAAVDSRAIEWYSRRADSTPEGAASAMGKKLEEFDWVVGDSARPGLRNTSHSGRLTGVSIGCQLGISHEVLRAWMIVISTTTVVTYVRRDYSVGPVGRSLMEFLQDKA